MPGKRPSCVLLADRHHGLTEGVRGLLETAFGTVVMVADEASLLDGADRIQPDVAVVDLSLAGGRIGLVAADGSEHRQGDRQAGVVICGQRTRFPVVRNYWIGRLNPRVVVA